MDVAVSNEIDELPPLEDDEIDTTRMEEIFNDIYTFLILYFGKTNILILRLPLCCEVYIKLKLFFTIKCENIALTFHKPKAEITLPLTILWQI
ncbi:hypothetical protein Anas_07048 [Armadillidium nasatum]|uniref:Uncharacterized protein n=1 Tax=Armadillidium nasatum TaxID=96803 RepID=A0A5N5T815_9CRUS|nr:hypothetical protein Anas_07048 [Armadillidium nasatum]